MEDIATSVAGAVPGTAVPGMGTPGFDPDRPVAFHPLVYLEEAGEVTVGRRDIDSYVILPAADAELIRALEAGVPPRDVAARHQERHGELVDIDELLMSLAELEFVRVEFRPDFVSELVRPELVRPDFGRPEFASEFGRLESPEGSEPRVRWQRLGTAVFHPIAMIGYALLVAAAVVLMVRHPDLAPSSRNVFFTRYYSIVEITMLLCQIPLMLVHEGAHALAGRRLGLASRLSIGRRMMYIVLVTSMDGLVSVPRRKRYLPLLAGLLADVVLCAVLTLVAGLLRDAGGSDGVAGFAARLCLAAVYVTILRIVWQFYFYLRTDMYYLVVTVLGCVDLHTTSTQMLRNRFRRLVGRPVVFDEARWHPTDRRVARWYSWLVLTGYVVTIVAFVFAVAPIAYRFLSGVVGNAFRTPNLGHVADLVVATGLTAGELGMALVMYLRERRAAAARAAVARTAAARAAVARP